MKYIHTVMVSMVLVFGTTRSQKDLSREGEASQSSVFLWAGFPLPAKLAITGPSTNNFSSKSCATTEDENVHQAFWMLYFPYDVVFKSIQIFYRLETPERLAGFSVYITNTSVTQSQPKPPDDDLCFKDLGPELPSINQTINCSSVGKNLVIFNERTDNVIEDYSPVAVLELCDVRVFGCIKTWYGPNCTLKCSLKCFDKHCYPDNGSCIWGCHCLHSNCNNASICTEGCQRTYGGIYCDLNNLGSFSKSFLYSNDVPQEVYTTIDGDKLSACSVIRGPKDWLQVDLGNVTAIKALYVTFTIQSDAKLKFKDHYLYFTTKSRDWTNDAILNISRDTEADNPDNTVVYNINNTALGRYVEIVPFDDNEIEICEVEIIGCSAGKYGIECNSTCPENCFGSCHPDTGLCSFGCNKGWLGDQCQTPCAEWFFGNCKTRCNCLNETCDNVQGLCPNKLCDLGWMGDTCSTECPVGRHGYHCESVCHVCYNKTCDRFTGNCTYGFCDEYNGVDCSMNVAGQQLQPTTSNTAEIAIGIVVPVIIIVLAIIGILLFRRRFQGKEKGGNGKPFTTNDNNYSNIVKDDTKQENATSGDSIDKTKCKVPNKGDSEQVNVYTDAKTENKDPDEYFYKNTNQEDIYQNCPSEQNVVTCKINILDLEYAIKERKLDDSAGFDKEFQILPKGLIHNHAAATEEQNKPKNRFLTTLPYDHSRVVLHDDPSRDYINANYIDGYIKDKAYIASQGPKKNTIDDFWRLVWQEKIEVIVMLTRLEEERRKKCDQYWPDTSAEPCKFGKLTVLMLKEKEGTVCTLRHIRVQDTLSKAERIVQQFEFIHWPDHGVPDTVKLVQFYRKVKNVAKGSMSPLLVHCSAGIGRTGTFIAIDGLYENGLRTNCVDVLEYTHMMREDRVNMIQTAKQYETVYKVLLELFTIPSTAIARQDLCDYVEDRLNLSTIKHQYQKLQDVKPAYSVDNFKAASLVVNSKKNADPNILPLDKYRPYLMSFLNPSNDYINAVIIPRYKVHKPFLVTQYPLTDTVPDFWTMVYDFDCTSIVLLETNSKQKVSLWPGPLDDTSLGNFQLNQGPDSSKEAVTVELLHKVKDDKRLVRVFEMTTWNSEGEPTYTQDLINLLQNIRSQSGAVTVVCRDGCEKSGVFVALSLIIEKLEMDDEVDIFQTVRDIQRRRPEFIKNFDQYQYCYQFIHDYLKADSDYVACDTIYANA